MGWLPALPETLGAGFSLVFIRKPYIFLPLEAKGQGKIKLFPLILTLSPLAERGNFNLSGRKPV